ncbi:MAG: hypothetical protein KJN64_07170 [Ignavibacteria bacterium]|nr:hypothetical protein [Ignavibacteria bacterium]MBT8381041.1 hypothetical protein [Ignavibacteria bacterium]MBT8393044.1 hypothetical protein [Ignavibacteria bacterium]NNJ52009.1 hypothetical protein [Ignavibacteriaceae bacterium]NNL19728.1 hypothetical protein [Ignavibacteriaceae bacterium]
MKQFLNRNIRYSITLKLSIVLSQLVIICLFYFFPNINYSAKLKSDNPIILIEDVPITVQREKMIAQKPEVPQIVIEDIIEEPELLADIIIRDERENEPLAGISSSVLHTSLSKNLTAPRQILEVLPKENKKNISGSLKLSLKISGAGKVVDHKILYNDLHCEDCLSEILTAVYNSKWKIGKNSSNNYEYWVEKTYSFY